MRLKEKIILGGAFIRARFSRARKPIFISWVITDQCNLRCKYCYSWHKCREELDTNQVLEVIKILSENGIRLIRFTGGEPLLRDDITTVINYCYDLGIFVTLATNGILFPSKIDTIKRLEGVSISIDGTEDINDSIRGANSYKKALEALKIAKKRKIPISISTTLNSYNLYSVECILEIAKRFDAKVFFQPATKKVLYGGKLNIFSPDIEQYKAVILFLVDLKRRNEFIGNSTDALKYLYNWPNRTPINCVAGKVTCRLDAQGNVTPCSRFIIKNKVLNIIEQGLRYCFEQVSNPHCDNCWCSSLVELNLISNFNMNSIFNFIKIR